MFGESPMELLNSLGMVSIVVLLVLLLFSVTSWGIIANKWWMFRTTDREEQQFLRTYELQPYDLKKVRNIAKDLPYSPSAAVFLGVVDRLECDIDLFGHKTTFDQEGEIWIPDREYLEKVVQYIIQRHIGQQEAYLPFLATTGNITPFIGLLGTVLGVINAFQEIGIQGSASIAAVAPGISEALVATAAGLFAAIPAVIAYNYFLTTIRKISFRVEAFSIEFLNSLAERTRDAKEVSVAR